VLDWNQCRDVESVADRLGGAWVFKRTRIPVAALFENLIDGASIAEFVDWFPGVTRLQAESVLRHVLQSLSEE
jgi:uncharacterized protein (DUF433 family)